MSPDFRKIALMGLCLFLAAALGRTESFKPQLSLSVGATGAGVIGHPGRVDPPSGVLAGNLLFQVRFVQVAALGLSYDYFNFVSGGTPWATSVNLVARIYPLAPKGRGEWFLQGGVGVMPSNKGVDPSGQRIHGTASLGYEINTPKNLFVDLSAVVDSFSPRNSALTSLGARVDVGCHFGPGVKKAKAAEMKAETAKPAPTPSATPVKKTVKKAPPAPMPTTTPTAEKK